MDDIAAIAAIFSIAQGVAGDLSSSQLAGKILSQKTYMPPEEIAAMTKSNELSNEGIPGEKFYEQNIKSMTEGTLEGARKVAQNPSDVITMAGEAISRGNEMYNKLAADSASVHLDNIKENINTLQHGAGMDLSVQGANINENISGFEQKAQGTKDLMSSVNQGIGNAINVEASNKKMSYLKDQNDILSSFFKNNSTPPETATPPTPLVANPDANKPDINAIWEKSVANFNSSDNSSYDDFKNNILSRFGFLAN
jgi:hypothetical protein